MWRQYWEDGLPENPGLVGDRCRGTLRIGLWEWLINGGDPNHLLTGMSLQVQILTQETEIPPKHSISES